MSGLEMDEPFNVENNNIFYNLTIWKLCLGIENC